MEFTFTFLNLFVWSIYLVAPILIFLSCAVMALGQVVARIEKWYWFDGLYWTFITATTVGYGDIRPLKKRSKILSVFIAFIGLLFTGIFVAVAIHSTSVAIEKHGDISIVEKIKDEIKK